MGLPPVRRTSNTPSPACRGPLHPSMANAAVKVLLEGLGEKQRSEARNEARVMQELVRLRVQALGACRGKMFPGALVLPG
jgi:hypothetical protein